MLAQGECAGVGGDVGDEGAAAGGGVGGEGEDGLDFGVFGEDLGVVERDGGAGGVDFVAALLGSAEGLGDAVGVAEEEVGGVDEDSFGPFGGYGEAGQDGLGEGLANGQELVGVGGGRPEHQVRLDEEDLGAGALEVDDFAGGGLAAIEAEIVRAGAVGEGVGVEVVFL